MFMLCEKCVDFKLTARHVCQMKIQIGAYFEEAQWFHEGNVPTIEEYMQVARVSSSFPLTTAISFIGTGEIITKEAFDWVYNDPFTVASCLIARLMNDMTSHEVTCRIYYI